MKLGYSANENTEEKTTNKEDIDIPDILE